MKQTRPGAKQTLPLESLLLGVKRTLAELASRHKVHPNLITKWKRQATEGMVDVFSGKQGTRDGSHEAEVKDLHAKIGELTVEKDFLAKAFGR